MRSFLLCSSSGSSKYQVASATCQHRPARVKHTGIHNGIFCRFQQSPATSAHLQVPNAWQQQQADGSLDGQVQQQQQQQHSNPLAKQQCQHSNPLAKQQCQHNQQPGQSAGAMRQPDTGLIMSSEAPLEQQHTPTLDAVAQEQRQHSQKDLQRQQQPSTQQTEGGSPDSSTVVDGAGDGGLHTDQAVGSSSTPTESDLESRYTYFYTPYLEAVSSPVPVQMPPPDASTQPVKPFFNSRKYLPPNFLKYYTAPPGSVYNFLSFLGEHEPAKGKFLAVGGDLDAFLTSYYRTIALANRRMFLAECYQGQPFKFYQELDFPWSLDPQLVLQLIPQVLDVVKEEVARVYEDQIPHGTTPKAVLSMRTIYKVHINYPGINTMESKAGVVRKAVINRCRAQLSGQPPLEKLKAELVVQEHWQEATDQLLQLQQLMQQLQDAETAQQMPAQAQQLLLDHQQLLQSTQHSSTITFSGSSRSAVQSPPPPSPPPPLQQQQQPLQQEAEDPQSQQQVSLQAQQQQLDWESIVDFPHGSLRLLGSCKSPWMDGDPEWVTEKAYSPVQWVGGVWMRQPLTLAAIMECSIQLQEGELRVFEQTEEFLDVVFQAAQQREEVLAAKRVKRAAKKQVEFVQLLLQDPTQQLPGVPTAKGRPVLTPEEKAAKAGRQKQRRLEEVQRQAQEAAAKAHQAQKKAEALARLQASAANSRPVLQRPKLSRPLAQPPQPPAQPPPAR